MANSKKNKNDKFNLDELAGQLDEATGTRDGYVLFTFGGVDYRMRPPHFMDNEEIQTINRELRNSEELTQSSIEIIVPEEDLEKFYAAGGNNILLAFPINDMWERFGKVRAGNPTS